MATDNKGQFGKRSDTHKQAVKGGKMSHGGGSGQSATNTGSGSNLTDADRVEGGEHSHDNQYTTDNS
jgi:hypothetical protein